MDAGTIIMNPGLEDMQGGLVTVDILIEAIHGNKILYLGFIGRYVINLVMMPQVLHTWPISHEFPRFEQLWLFLYLADEQRLT